jgi:phosphoenolpyruvate phosphomutase
MTLISKTIKISIDQEKWLESHPEINFSEWIRKKIDESIKNEKGLKSKKKIKAIIVAAGHDKRIEPLNEQLPKCMLDVKGKTILDRQIDTLKSCGISDIVIVKGYKQETIDIPNTKYYLNPNFEKTGIVSSLFFAEKEMNSDFIFLYSDIIFDKKILNKLLKDSSDISLVVDLDWKERYKKKGVQPGEEVELVEVKNDKITKIGKKIKSRNIHGEFIGLAMFTKKGAETLKKIYKKALTKYNNKKFHESPSFKKAYFTDMMQEIIDNGITIKNVDTYGDWMEIDTFDDYKRAWSEISS